MNLRPQTSGINNEKAYPQKSTALYGYALVKEKREHEAMLNPAPFWLA
ncbi:hypothetical protein SH449x_000908 [Pirellulaceae bacterium SH449]